MIQSHPHACTVPEEENKIPKKKLMTHQYDKMSSVCRRPVLTKRAQLECTKSRDSRGSRGWFSPVGHSRGSFSWVFLVGKPTKKTGTLM